MVSLPEQFNKIRAPYQRELGIWLTVESTREEILNEKRCILWGLSEGPAPHFQGAGKEDNSKKWLPRYKQKAWLKGTLPLSLISICQRKAPPLSCHPRVSSGPWQACTGHPPSGAYPQGARSRRPLQPEDYSGARVDRHWRLRRTREEKSESSTHCNRFRHWTLLGLQLPPVKWPKPHESFTSLSKFLMRLSNTEALQREMKTSPHILRAQFAGKISSRQN